MAPLGSVVSASGYVAMCAKSCAAPCEDCWTMKWPGARKVEPETTISAPGRKMILNWAKVFVSFVGDSAASGKRGKRKRGLK